MNNIIVSVQKIPELKLNAIMACFQKITEFWLSVLLILIWM